LGPSQRHREEIERAYGRELSWDPLEGKRACRLAQRFELGGYRDEPEWPQVQDAMIDAMMRLERALGPYIAELTI
jgi:hypothetical protein